MDGEFKGMRFEVAGCPGMKDRAIELSGGGKRAADVTMALGPSRADFQQPFICRRGVRVLSTIAEDPGREICYLFLLGPQREGDAGAFDGVLTPATMQQGLAETAKKDGELILGKFALRQINATGLDEIGSGTQLSGATYGLFKNFVEIGHCAIFSGGADREYKLRIR
jgi:hypothetical protein